MPCTTTGPALSILAAAAQEPGALDDIAVWEVVEVLRPLARLGYSQRALTEQAARLSLERDEAEVLAAAVAEEHEEPGISPRRPIPSRRSRRIVTARPCLTGA